MHVIINLLTFDHSGALDPVKVLHATVENSIGFVLLSAFIQQLGQINHAIESLKVLITIENP